MGYTPFIQDTGKIYKYVIAVNESLPEVKFHLGEIRKKYPDAFIVKNRGREDKPSQMIRKRIRILPLYNGA